MGWTFIPANEKSPENPEEADIQTRDGLDTQWVTTNVAAVKARTTQGSLAFDITDSEVPVRFFQVREQPGLTAC